MLTLARAGHDAGDISLTVTVDGRESGARVIQVIEPSTSTSSNPPEGPDDGT